MALILYIDDDAHYARLINTLLSSRGFTVETARDGLDGVRKARQLRPDLILLDLYLPCMGGKGVVARLRNEALTSHIPIVVLSALPVNRCRQILQGAGVEDFIPKPFRLDDLVGAIRKNLPCCAQQLPAPRVH